MTHAEQTSTYSRLFLRPSGVAGTEFSAVGTLASCRTGISRSLRRCSIAASLSEIPGSKPTAQVSSLSVELGEAGETVRRPSRSGLASPVRKAQTCLLVHKSRHIPYILILGCVCGSFRNFGRVLSDVLFLRGAFLVFVRMD